MRPALGAFERQAGSSLGAQVGVSQAEKIPSHCHGSASGVIQRGRWSSHRPRPFREPTFSRFVNCQRASAFRAATQRKRPRFLSIRRLRHSFAREFVAPSLGLSWSLGSGRSPQLRRFHNSDSSVPSSFLPKTRPRRTFHSRRDHFPGCCMREENASPRRVVHGGQVSRTSPCGLSRLCR